MDNVGNGRRSCRHRTLGSPVSLPSHSVPAATSTAATPPSSAWVYHSAAPRKRRAAASGLRREALAAAAEVGAAHLGAPAGAAEETSPPVWIGRRQLRAVADLAAKAAEELGLLSVGQAAVSLDALDDEPVGAVPAERIGKAERHGAPERARVHPALTFPVRAALAVELRDHGLGVRARLLDPDDHVAVRLDADAPAEPAPARGRLSTACR